MACLSELAKLASARLCRYSMQVVRDAITLNLVRRKLINLLTALHTCELRNFSRRLLL
jgi:hypothetical protein